MHQSSEFLHVSLAHRYWKQQWSREQNRLVYGQSASSEGVGSNMILQLCAEGESAVDFKPALALLKRQVDHRCLFEEVAAFKAEPSTLERVTEFIKVPVFALELPSGQTWKSLSVRETPWLLARAYNDSNEIELELQVHNLTLHLRGIVDSTSGVLLERGAAEAAVKDLNFNPTIKSSREWAMDLLSNLKTKVKNLKGLTVDLGRQEKIVVTSES